MQFEVTVKVAVAASNQGEALAVLEKRVRAQGTAEDNPARIIETLNIKERK